MTDERGRGAADGSRGDGPDGSSAETPTAHAGGTQAAPAEGAQTEAAGPGNAEPEFGSSDWLLQQLTGGRRVGRRSAERGVPGDDSERAAEPAVRAADDKRATEAGPVPESAPGAVADERPSFAENDATVEPSPFDELLGSAADASTASPAEPVADVSPQQEFPVAFSWNLTPGTGGDPLVEDAATGTPIPEAAAEASPTGEGEGAGATGVTEAADASGAADALRSSDAGGALDVPGAEAADAETASSWPPVTPSADASSGKHALGAAEASGVAAEGARARQEHEDALPEAPRETDEVPPVDAAPTESEPPTADTPVAAGSWVIPSPAPTPPAAPESPRTIFDPPPAPPEVEPESHGLAALLGFGAPADGERSGRSVIGDTTSIIPLVPGAPPPPATPPAAEAASGGPTTGAATPPAAPPATAGSADAAPLSSAGAPAAAFGSGSEWAGSHQPDPWFDQANPEPPAMPVLPPIDAAALFEPTTDTPAHRADAAEIDALLREQSAPAAPSLPAGDAPTQVLPTTAPAAGFPPAAHEPEIELPSEPEIPAAEAEVALGGVPSPATSAIDAESIAAASEPTVFAEPGDAEGEGPEDAGAEDAGAEDAGAEEDGADEDGLALLFGDVADQEPATAGTGASLDVTPDAAPGFATDRAAGLEPEPEPAAATEGPQLAATELFVFPPYPEAVTADADRAEDAATVDDSAASEPGVAAGDAAAAAAASAASVEGGDEPTTATTPIAAQTGFDDASATSADRAAAFAAGAPLGGSASVTDGSPSTAAAPVGASPSSSAAVSPPTVPAGPGLWGTRNNRILFSIVGALAVLLVLVGLFALGTRIPSLFGAGAGAGAPVATASGPATPKATPSATPAPAPTVTPKPAAAVGPGTHPWNTLGGGECVQPFTSVWAEQFTVVDCTAAHAAQMVYTNVLTSEVAAPYPGADALAQQVPALCSATGVIDLGAAAAYPDLQVTGAFPATEQQWKDGQRSYYCFANRSGGEPLTSSVAGPGPAA